MRIAIFSEIFTPYISGISSYIEILKKGLIDLGHEVLIVTSNPRIKKLTFKNNILRCPAKKSSNQFGMACKNINERHAVKIVLDFKPDIIHIHTDTPIGEMGYLIADKLNIPSVFTIHDFYLERFVSEKNFLKKKFLEFRAKRKFRDAIDNTTVLSSSCMRAAEYVEAADRKRRIYLVPINTDKIQFDYRLVPNITIEKIRERMRIPKEKTIAVFAGRIEPDKNLKSLLQEWAQYILEEDNLHLVIVGKGSEIPNLQRLVRKYKIGHMVTFTGEIAHSYMPQFFSACDVYVSGDDGGLSSMAVQEAMACGLPAVLRFNKYNQEIVHQKITGFLYQSPQEFGEIMRMLASSDQGQKAILRSLVRRNACQDIPNYHLARYTEKVYKAARDKFYYKK